MAALGEEGGGGGGSIEEEEVLVVRTRVTELLYVVNVSTIY